MHIAPARTNSPLFCFVLFYFTSETTLIELYFKCIDRGLSILTGSGYTFKIVQESIADMIYTSCLAIIGKIGTCIIVAIGLQEVNSMISSVAKYEVRIFIY